MVSQGITLLGSTGSIGASTLNVLARHPDRYHVVALSAHSNVQRLAQQCHQHHARFAVISDESAKATELQQSALDRLKCNSRSPGTAGRSLSAVVRHWTKQHVVMAAIVGAAGLEPTLKAVQSR